MTTKRIIHASVGLLLAAVLLAAMSACVTVDTGNGSSEVTLERSDASSLAEQKIFSAESEEFSSEEFAPTSFQACSMTTDEMEVFGYWLYTPENPVKNMPLIVYLHGAGGRGEDLNLVVSDEDFPKYLQSGELGDVRAYVLIQFLSCRPPSADGTTSAILCIV